MINFPKEMRENECDVIFFLPSEKEDNIHIEQQVYKKLGKKIGGSVLGDSYHIILFKIDDTDGGIKDFDNFEGILIDPLTYIGNLITQNWYGLVAKKTTSSKKFIKSTIDKLQKVC
jgi:hypothetical protein